jgi:3',5'-cyclic-AMP phosphodiesterase
MYKLFIALMVVPLLLAGSPSLAPEAVPATVISQPTDNAVRSRTPETIGTAGPTPLPIPAGSPSATESSSRAQNSAMTGSPAPASEQPLLTFSVLSDIHVSASDSRSSRKLAAALEDLHTVDPQADALIINGDLTNGAPADYRKLQSLLKQAKLPNNVLFTIGNHEFYQAWMDKSGSYQKAGFPHDETEAASIGRFLKFTKAKQVYYARTIRHHRFIILGSEQYRQSDPSHGEDAFLSKTQLAWLKKELKRASSGRLASSSSSSKPIFVFLHQPLPYTVAGSEYYVNTRAVIQHKELKAILSAYPQVVFFTGHTHWELRLPRTLVRDKFTLVNSSSVHEPLTERGTEGEQPVSPDASEGLYVAVYKDRLDIKGRDFHGRQWVPEAQFVVPTGEP